MQEKFTLGDMFLCSIESEANSKMITCAELTVEWKHCQTHLSSRGASQVLAALSVVYTCSSVLSQLKDVSGNAVDFSITMSYKLIQCCLCECCFSLRSTSFVVRGHDVFLLHYSNVSTVVYFHSVYQRAVDNSPVFSTFSKSYSTQLFQDITKSFLE